MLPSPAPELTVNPTADVPRRPAPPASPNIPPPLTPLAIAALLRRHAYRAGVNQVLSAGGSTDEYLDLLTPLTSPVARGVLAMAALSAITLSGTPMVERHLVAGVEFGGALFAGELSSGSGWPLLVARKSRNLLPADPMGLPGIENVETFFPRTGDADRDRIGVWLLEDVVTTGGSVMRAVDRIAAFGRLRLLGVIAAADREAGGLDAVRRHALERTGEPVYVHALATLSAVRQADPKHDPTAKFVEMMIAAKRMGAWPSPPGGPQGGPPGSPPGVPFGRPSPAV